MANRGFAKSFAQALAERLRPIGMMARFAQHHASPERKERRRIVKLAGRRQAIKHFKDMRVINKLNEVNHG
jgi:hypothetical protein